MLHYIEGLKNILAHNFSRLQCLISTDQLAEGKKLNEPVVVSNDEDADYTYFLDSYFSGLIYNVINYAL